MAGDADNARKVARSATSSPVTNVIAVEPVTIVLDFPALGDDDFVFTPSDGKSVTYSYKTAEDVDPFHSRIVLPVKQKSSVTYTLVHRRSGKAAQTLFKGVKGADLVAKSAAPRSRYKTLNSYTLVTETPHDRDLRASILDYSKLVHSGTQITKSLDREMNKDSAAVKTAYDRATAVISRRCRFVEWNFFGGNPGDAAGTWPFTYHTERGHDSYEGSWSEIEGERWIYVYRRPATGGEFDQPEWTDEFHLDAKGQLSSLLPAPQPIGSSICFARRIRGVAQEYYFFATRFRLPDEAAKDLRHLIARFSVPVNFEVNDRGLAYFDQSENLIPVLDPLTVGLNLHRCAIAAIDDCLNYTSTHKADRRLKKNLLAHLVKLIASADPTARGKLKNDGYDLDKFILQFEMQVKYRNSIREVWASALVKWLKGEPIRWLSKVYLSPPVFKKSFDQFFTFWGNAVYGLSETNIGKDFLRDIAKDSSHWVQSIALGAPGHEFSELFGLYRKFQNPALEIGTELAKALALRKEPELAAKALQHAINQINGTPGASVIAIHPKQIAFTTASGDIKSVTATEWKLGPAGQLHAELTEAEQKLHGPSRKQFTLKAVVEAMNLYYAGDGIYSGWKEATGEQKAFAVLNLFGAGLDASTTVLEFSKARFESKISEEALDYSAKLGKVLRTAETIAVLGFISSAMDILTGVGDTVDAINQKNTGAALGSSIATVGSFISLSAAFWSLAPLAEAGPIGLVGALLIGAGTLIKTFWGAGPTNYQLFLAHCEWGEDAGKDTGKPTFSRYNYREWIGNYNAQLEAAVSLLCAPRIAPDPKDRRFFQLDIDWFPPGCKLDVFYEETWDPPGTHTPMRGTFVLTQDGPVTMSGILSMKPGGGSGYRIGPAGKVPLDPITDIGDFTYGNDGLKKLVVGVILEINSGKYSFSFPSKDRSYTTLFEAH